MARKKKEVVELTQEEKLKRLFEKDMMTWENVPENPTYRFNIGDSVVVGNLKDCVIKDIVEDGKYYLIEYTHVDNNYGNPIETPGYLMYRPWVDVRPCVKEDNGFIQAEDYFNLSYSQREVDSLLHMIYSFGVDFSPEYQRDFVWSEEDKVALIDSIFHGIDIGKFVFIHRGYSEDVMFEILDGKQRLKTLQEFYENRFAYKGKYYNDLSNKERGWFRRHHVSYAEIKNLSQEQKLKVFIALNSSGHVMSNEHLDKVKAMYKDLTNKEF